ncbi:MAG: site-specific integrase [Thermoplasmataceae archaeon]
MGIKLPLEVIDVLTLKKSKKLYRTLPLHNDLKDSVMQYLLGFHIDMEAKDSLFPIRRQSVDEYLEKIEEHTGIKINAHKFRHTFAVKVLLDGVQTHNPRDSNAHPSMCVSPDFSVVLPLMRRGLTKILVKCIGYIPGAHTFL